MTKEKLLKLLDDYYDDLEVKVYDAGAGCYFPVETVYAESVRDAETDKVETFITLEINQI